MDFVTIIAIKSSKLVCSYHFIYLSIHLSETNRSAYSLLQVTFVLCLDLSCRDFCQKSVQNMKKRSFIISYSGGGLCMWVCVCVWKRESLWNAVFMKDYPLWEVCIEIPMFSSAYDLSAMCEYVYLLTRIVSKARNSLEARMQVQGKKQNVRHILLPLCCSIQTVDSRL